MGGFQLSFNPSFYRDEFIRSVASHLSDLAIGLSVIRSENPSGEGMRLGGMIELRYPGVDLRAGAEQRHLHHCLSGIVRAFIAFLDRMISFQRLRTTGLIADHQLVGEVEVRQFVERRCEEEFRAVARDHSLTTDRKLASFPGLSAWSQAAAAAYFLLRNCFEHHQGIARRSFDVEYKELHFLVDGTQITELPHIIRAGQQAQVSVVTGVKTIREGESVSITETELRGIAFALEMVITSEIAQLM